MAIFHKIISEDVVQVDDKTRIDVSKSFVSPDEAAISLYEVDPGDGSGFIDVTTNRYLDWQYSADGAITITSRITTDGAPTTKTQTISIVTEVDDKLFSNDKDLVEEEDDILDYVRDGRNSFLDKHRLAQELILDDLNDANIRDSKGDRLTKDAVVDIKEVHEWSKYLTLMIIFDNQSNVVGDIFDEKARMYESKMLRAKSNGFLRLDRTGDGLDKQLVDTTAGDLNRRG